MSRRCTSTSSRRGTTRAIPNLLRTRGSYERLADDNPDLNTVWPVRPNPEPTAHISSASIARTDRWQDSPRCARRSSIAAIGYPRISMATSSSLNRQPISSAVSSCQTTGRTCGRVKAYDRGEFLASTDERFRPVFLTNAPDGTLYIADMYRGIIEHRISVTEYLRDQIVARKLDQPTGYGRIYRVMHDSTRRDSTIRSRERNSATTRRRTGAPQRLAA